MPHAGGADPAAAGEPDQAARLERFNRSFAAERRRTRLHGGVIVTLFLAALIVSAVVSKASPDQLAAGLPDAWNYIWSTMPSLHRATIWADLADWYWDLPRWLALLAETVLMSFLATVMGGAAALLLCFPASKDLMRNRFWHFVCCRFLEIARTVPDLVYALIFVFALGIGPLPGVMALAVHTTGALGKLFSEVNETIDQRPLDGVLAAGGNWPALMRMAVLPQVLPNFVSYALLRFEYNIRSASVLGIVGAGGIGEELYLSIRQFDYTDISAIVLLIILVVMAADLICESIRHRLIGQAAFARALA